MQFSKKEIEVLISKLREDLSEANKIYYEEKISEKRFPEDKFYNGKRCGISSCINRIECMIFEKELEEK